MPLKHDHYMKIALEESHAGLASGRNPVDSVIVRDRDGEVLGRGGNFVAARNDPTAHAEVMAIRTACEKLGTPHLPGCTLYTTLEPCPMCCWAIVSAGIGRLVLGGRLTVVKKVNYGDYTVEKLLAMAGESVEVMTGVREEECTRLRREWEKG